MKDLSIGLFLGFFLTMFVIAQNIPDPRAIALEMKREILTVYNSTGRVVNQYEDAKGFHRISGLAKLVAGVDTINLNTNVTNGLQDLSFRADSTYNGLAWSSVIGNRAKTYSILPVNGTQFIVISSDATDTATIRWQVAGE